MRYPVLFQISGLSAFDVEHAQCLTGYHVFMVSGLDLARAHSRTQSPSYARSTERDEGHPRPQAQARAALTVALGQAVDLRRNSDAEAWSHSICIPVAFP